MKRTLRGQVKGDTTEVQVATEPQRFGNVNWHLLANSVHFVEQNATYFHFLSSQWISACSIPSRFSYGSTLAKVA